MKKRIPDKNFRFITRGTVFDNGSPKTHTLYKHGSLISSPSKQASFDITYIPPKFVSPLLSEFLYYVPESKSLLYEWYRFFYRYHPLVGPIIDMHCELPLSRFTLEGISDPAIKDFYESLVDRLDLYQVMFDILLSYNVFGLAPVYMPWDDELGIFKKIIILPPDYVTVIGHPLQTVDWGIVFTPDEGLKSIANSDDPVLQKIKESIPEIFIRAVEENKSVLLSDLQSFAFVRYPQFVNLSEGSYVHEVRGTSMISRVLRYLLYEEQLMRAYWAVAQRRIAPREVWKLGDPNLPWIPSNEDLADFTNMLQAAENSHNFTIVTHYAVDYMNADTAAGIRELGPEFERITDNIIAGLMSNKAFLTGEGPTYNNASVAMRVLMSRYQPLRDRLADLITQKIFVPIARHQRFFRITSAELDHNVRIYPKLEYIVPKIKWESKAYLLDDEGIRNALLQLRSAGDVPLRKVLQALYLDPDEIIELLEKEQGTVADPTTRDVRNTLITSSAQDVASGNADESKWRNIFKKVFNLIKELRF